MANSGNFRHVYAAGIINHPVGLSRAGAPCHGQQSANQALKAVSAAGVWPRRAPRARGGHGVPVCPPCFWSPSLPAGAGLAGSPRKHCPAGDRKLNSSLPRWHPSCHGSAGRKSSVIRGPQRRRGAQLAPLALCAPHRSRGAVGGRGSGSASLPDYFWAPPQTDAAGSARLRAVPGVPRGARPCRQLRAGTFPAVPCRHPVPTGGRGAARCRGSAAR